MTLSHRPRSSGQHWRQKGRKATQKTETPMSAYQRFTDVVTTAGDLGSSSTAKRSNVATKV